MALKTLNLGILAHVDAGKTTLTERLLFASGVIGEPGSVDKGTTQTDSLALEQQRGITIKSAVVSFAIDGVTVNLIDTPGHPDFIAEVERVLSVLDGAVLVVSAVEGVQSQTPLLMRALQRLSVPTLIFVNKIDRPGAGEEGVLAEIAKRLSPALAPLGSTERLGSRGAAFRPWHGDDTAKLAEELAEHDDRILAAYVEDDGISAGRLRRALADQTKRGLVYPVFFGSAITGAGVDALMSGIAELLPAAGGDADAPLSGRVFKIERGPSGEKVAYARLFTGMLQTRDRVRFGEDTEEKVTAMAVFDDGSAIQRPLISAGEIGKLWGLSGVQIGDEIGRPQSAGVRRQFPPPTLESVVAPLEPDDGARLRVALAQLAEQDPLIDVRQDDRYQEISVSLYGEVQKEVIEATLATDYGLDVTFHETTMICVERPVRAGEAVEVLHAETNPFAATIGLRVAPAPVDSGIDFRLDVDARTVPDVHLQDARPVHRRDGPVRPPHARGGALRLAGHRLHRDHDAMRLPVSRRVGRDAGTAEHAGGLPEAHAARADAGARARSDGGLRAHPSGAGRAADGIDRRGPRRGGTAGRRRAPVDARRGAHLDRDRAPCGAGPGASAPATGADGR